MILGRNLERNQTQKGTHPHLGDTGECDMNNVLSVFIYSHVGCCLPQSPHRVGSVALNTQILTRQKPAGAGPSLDAS
ncbi:hypothetical protein PGIGA_G00209480, partial [Pangasianodon gigas]|nr:hypothetical protein [Pangasianodon gigas]